MQCRQGVEAGTRFVVAPGVRNQLFGTLHTSWKKKLLSCVCEKEEFARRKRASQVERTTYTKALRYGTARNVWGNTGHYLRWEYGIREGARGEPRPAPPLAPVTPGPYCTQ